MQNNCGETFREKEREGIKSISSEISKFDLTVRPMKKKHSEERFSRKLHSLSTPSKAWLCKLRTAHGVYRSEAVQKMMHYVKLLSTSLRTTCSEQNHLDDEINSARGCGSPMSTGHTPRFHRNDSATKTERMRGSRGKHRRWPRTRASNNAFHGKYRFPSAFCRFHRPLCVPWTLKIESRLQRVSHVVTHHSDISPVN